MPFGINLTTDVIFLREASMETTPLLCNVMMSNVGKNS